MLATITIRINPYRNDILLWLIAIISIAISYSTFYIKSDIIFSTYTPPIQKNLNGIDEKIKKQNSNLLKKTHKILFSVDGLKTYEAGQISQIIHTFKALNYSIANIRKDKVVHSIQPNRIPNDFNSIIDVKQRKDIFISMMLPLALKINEDIIAKRKQLFSIIKSHNNTGKINGQQQLFIDHISLEFGVKKSNTLKNTLKALSLRVDSLPVSLIIAQGAVESGWGTSRFSITGNALFGQWTWAKNKGIVPLGREKGKTHSIKSFSSPYQSMKAYVNNINTNPAYAKLRYLRRDLHNKNIKPTGIILAQTLDKYSQEREKYVEKLSIIIKSNTLESFNNLHLYSDKK